MTMRSRLIFRATPVFVALALLLGQAATALADYGAREGEAEKMLAETKMPEEEREALEDALEAYFAAREKCLNDLVEILAETDEDPLKERFAIRAEACAANGSEPFDDALDDFDPPSVGALGFVNVFQADEGPFMGGLAGLNVARARDVIVTIRVRLEQKSGDLHEFWTTTDAQDNSIDKRAQTQTKEIGKLLQQTIKDAAERHKDVHEQLRDLVKKAAGHPGWALADLDPTLKVIKTGISGIATAWEFFDKSVERRGNAFTALFKSEIRVIVMFNDTREATKKFVKTNGYARAEVAHRSAESSMGDFVGAAETSGQKSDAEVFHSAVMGALTRHLRETQDVYKEFVSRHKAHFFGPCADVEKAILEPDQWRRDQGNLRGFALHRKLREFEDDAEGYFGVDLSGLTSEQREYVTKKLGRMVEEMVRDMEDAGTTWREVYEELVEGREDVEDALDC